jgi:exonuclease SbcC
MPADAPTQAEFENCETTYNDALAAASAANEKRSNLSTELNVAIVDLAGTIAAQAIAVDVLTAAKKTADDAVTRLNSARERETKTVDALEAANGKEKMLTAEIAELKTVVGVLKTEVANLKKELKHENEIAANAELENSRVELKKSKDALDVKTKDFNDTENEISALTALISDGEKSASEVAAKLGVGASPQDERGYSTRKAELAEQSAVAEREEHDAINAKNNNERVAKELAECREKLKTSENLYGDANLLSQTANGTLTGKNKLKFETYVQQVYFDMVLAEANKRFGTMTDGRYELTRQVADKLQGKAGLDIDVFDTWSQKSRPAKTLSGGESFKAALSLALGLSDVVQSYSGGIRIDAMFIDEGFGSLDNESLDSAMSVIAGLADGSRLVGIISHVDALKERIPAKIRVERDKSGSRLGV